MKQDNKDKIDQTSVNLQDKSEGYIIHAVRVATKLGVSLALFVSNNQFALILSGYLLFTEILDQISLIIIKEHPKYKKWAGVLYSFNSVAVISVIAYLANWTLNDFYLIYLIHISSSTLGYGFKNGIISFSLSVVSYSFLLYLSNAPLPLFIRLPIIGVLVLRLLMNQKWYEKIHQTLTDLMSVERSKQDFIGLASHNFRTPVAAIYGYIDLLLRGDAGPLNDEQTMFLERIKGNNQELEKITEQLLQISVLEVGKEINILKQPSQIETLISDVIEKYEPQAKSKGITLSFQKGVTPLPLISIDTEKIKSVLVNLVDNAVKYTEKGGVTVTAAQQDNVISISIKDTGIGISEEELSKVFGKFYRSGNILIYNQTGVGLGLFLGKKIIELHQGTVSIESTLGQGTTFMLTLPITKEEIL